MGNDGDNRARFKSRNFSYMFQKEYFLEYSGMKEKVDEKMFESIKSIQQDMLLLSKEKVEVFQEQLGANVLFFEVQYPGLLMGMGYPHETIKNDSRTDQRNGNSGLTVTGIFLDYVTGVPYYPGSSLKGKIRSVFEAALKDTKEGEEYREYFGELLGKKVSKESLHEIMLQIFEQGDVFLDGYIVDANKELVSKDTLAPHESEIKNPVPINMIRVHPGTTIALPIIFSNKKCAIPVKERKQIYIEMIKLFGIGAKTNVGYGNLKYINNYQLS